MAYRRVRNYGNTMGATSGTETANSWYSSVLVTNKVQILNISNLYISDVKNNIII
jgi:hypothetical protein